MNLTSLITFPVRLGYEVARRTLDIAAGAGRLVGLGGGASPEPAPRVAKPQRRKRPKPGMDDATLSRKVETVLFRSRTVTKGKIDVNCAEGVVWLRGEAKTPQQIKQLEAKAAAIPEVKRVENLLHLPKTPAPTRTDTPASQRRTRRSPAKPKAARREAAARRSGAPPKRTTAETHSAPVEPSPAKLAQTGEGRQPAPMGSSDANARQLDDVTLTRKVETEIFREDGAPKGSVDVNAAAGVVWLRGEAPTQEQIRALVARAEAVAEVKRVENLLRVPETPTAAVETPTATTAESPAIRRFPPEEPSGTDEPLPAEGEDRGESRQPAPLGASDDAPGGGGGGDARTWIP